MANEINDLGYDNLLTRNVFPLPLSKEFFNSLQDRLSTCVENVLFAGDTRFTLLINAIPRSGTEPKVYQRSKTPDFIYAGCDKQQELLERWGNKTISGKNYKDAWTLLPSITIVPKKSAVSADVYKKIQKGKYKISDVCEINSLNKYFEDLKTTKKLYKVYEYNILNEFFDLKQDVFISLPLIGYAELDGLVHIIFKKDMLSIPGVEEVIVEKNGEEKTIQRLPHSIIWSLIRCFIVEYDGLFLDWDSVGENLEKISATYHFLKNTIFKSGEYFFDPKKNLIFKELKLQQYYKTHTQYFLDRLALGEGVPGKIYQQYVTNAVTAILIDSYAHNVSAHALSTLSWWYYRRASRLKDEEMNWDALIARLKGDPDIDSDTLRNFNSQIIKRREKRKKQNKSSNHNEEIRKEDGLEIINYPGSLTREMSRLLRFLTEKGAYWSGVTRDASVGGKISSLYSVLWHDFINNPFYIGTIAKTEDILHVKVRIVLYDPESPNPRLEKTEYHQKTFLPKNDGILAWVDLSNPRKDMTQLVGKSHEDVISAFVHKGDRFEHFRKLLKSIRVFFPGGVVGRHAFYTMIENEIRNVKHYNREELKVLQQEGLTIAIGIQPCSLHDSDAEEMYRISVWLDTPTRLGEGKNHIVERKWETLQGEIFAENTYAPLLGGTYQDKVCAAFLMNGHFSHVQRGDRNSNRDKNKDTNRDRQFYPWVRPACSTLQNKEPNLVTHTDYKLSYNTPLEAPIDLPTEGYLKKVFYLWRGERLMDWHGDNSSDSDNSSRFVIVRLADDNEAALLDLRREKGVVRVVAGELSGKNELEKFASAYKLWLKKLIGDDPFYALEATSAGKTDYILALDNQEDVLRFIYEKSLPSAATPMQEAVKEVFRTDSSRMPQWRLPFAHGSDDSSSEKKFVIRYRSHGILKNYFLPEDHKPPMPIDDTLMMELFEVLATKVCIFDSRIYQRMRLEDRREEFNIFLRDKLKLAVHREGSASPKEGSGGWIAELSQPEIDFLKGCHFLVMHLSFIESILQREMPNLRPNDTSNVGLFIEKMIMPLVGERENFFFVVTTGRGRNEWWTSLGKDNNRKFAKFTLFRPIESLLTAIENSIGMEDDVELKYRIVKILYGS